MSVFGERRKTSWTSVMAYWSEMQDELSYEVDEAQLKTKRKERGKEGADQSRATTCGPPYVIRLYMLHTFRYVQP